ncbi:unnamed protein product [Bursaphelenchus xylophilus]|uniref:(pine wood nematode) hypothetical protein n=1 Tax=Bursaphelenchus xylophilus TaxID=6326 RepID=A0A1I7SC93_BURXY|nr:unnamed protein product [Bursaphelenchus xylophilus]CAG9094527.1 unnamed protein product [Bursaphelenchus xylophilus]
MSLHYGESAKQRVPSPPLDLQVVALNATTFRVAWNKPEHSNGQIFGYYVYQDKLVDGAPTPNGRKKNVLWNQNANHTIVSDLEPNSEYIIRVNAFNENGDGEFANSETFRTGRSPPEAPRPQSVSLMDENPPLRARVEWLPAPDRGDNARAPVKDYLVWYRATDSDGYWKNVRVAGSETSAVLEDLNMGTEYEIRLAAQNEDGRSDNVTERLNTPVGRPSAPPLNIRYSISGDKATFQWDPPMEEFQNGPITGYHAVLACSDNTPPRHQTVTRQWSQYTIDLKKSYGFRVAASTSKGDGPFADQIRVHPADGGWFTFELLF